jgi:DNA-binding MarR family transcriptional regulator
MQMQEVALSTKPRKTIDGDVYVPSLLNHLSNGLSAGASRTYLKHFDVGINDWRVMSALVNHPRTTAKRVSEVLGVNKAIISRSVGVLESKRLLKVNTET